MRKYLTPDGHFEEAVKPGYRGFTFGEVRGVNANKRQVTAILSTSGIDSYGESIDQDGWDFSRFDLNPVLLANHQHGSESGQPTSLGRWVKYGVKTIPGKGKCLVGTCEFLRDDALAESWWQRFLQGAVSAFSVGFLSRGTERRVMDVDGEKRRVLTHTRMLLLEISAVTIPANQDCVVLAAAAGGVPGMGPSAEPDGLERWIDQLGLRRGTNDNAGGMSNRRTNKVLSRSMQPMVAKALSDALDPDNNPNIVNLITDVIHMVLPAILNSAGSRNHTSAGQSSRAKSAPPAPRNEIDELLGTPSKASRNLAGVGEPNAVDDFGTPPILGGIDYFSDEIEQWIDD